MFDNTQKKMLEKMYARVFDISPGTKGKAPELTEEGQILLQRANIRVADLIPKSYDDFLKQEMSTDVSSMSPRGKKVPKPEPSVFMGTTLGDSAKKGLFTTRANSGSKRDSLTENVTVDGVKSRKT